VQELSKSLCKRAVHKKKHVSTQHARACTTRTQHATRSSARLLVHSELMRLVLTGKVAGYGFVEFPTTYDAEQVLIGYQGKPIANHPSGKSYKLNWATQGLSNSKTQVSIDTDVLCASHIRIYIHKHTMLLVAPPILQEHTMLLVAPTHNAGAVTTVTTSNAHRISILLLLLNALSLMHY